MKSVLRAVVLAFAAALVLGLPRAASAQERRIEASAKDAIKRARADFSAADFDGALARLLKAQRACGTIRCSAPTRAALFRDAGVMQLRRGDGAKAEASFREALRADKRVELPAPFDVPDVRAEWDAAVDEAAMERAPQPQGDFGHTPAPEQTVRTPVPIYVEYGGGDSVASVVAKYRGPGDADWKRVNLVHSGRGWGGYVPCGDVKRGVLRYYVQGVDAGGAPNALSGDPKHPFHVAIRHAIVGQPPSLPGQPPPSGCTAAQGGPAPVAAEQPPAHVEEPAQCVDDSMCNGGACQNGHCVEPVRAEESRTSYARFWVGVSGSFDVTLLPSSSDVCLLDANAVPLNSNGYACINADGSDYPTHASSAQNNALSPGNAGAVSGAPVMGNVRVLLTADYAFSGNVLVGARVGLVGHTYPGTVSFHTPVHGELRGTYLFGANPLSHAGFAPLVFLNAGAAEQDASVAVPVIQNGVPGVLRKEAWRTGGPLFVGGGGGVRYGFSQRVGFTFAARLAIGIGGKGIFPAVGPELGLAYGF